MKIEDLVKLSYDASLSYKVVSYALQENPSFLKSIDKEHLIVDELKLVHDAVCYLLDNGSSIDPVLINNLITKQNPSISPHLIGNILSTYKDFNNIIFETKKLRENYFKYDTTKSVVRNILSQTTSNKDLDIQNIESLHKDLGKAILELKGEKYKLKTFEDMTPSQTELFKLRNEGLRKRTMGYEVIDDKLDFPLKEGTQTSIVSLKNFGKTTFAKNIIYRLLRKQVCVLDFDMDMDATYTYDKFIMINSQLKTSDLLMTNKPRDLVAKIRGELSYFSGIKNYLHFENLGIGLTDVELIIEKAQEHFRKMGVLPPDGYMVCIFDTLDMLEDFGGAKPEQIKEGVNHLHKILRDSNTASINLLQANENKLRNMKFNKPEDLEFYRISLQDIEGGASYASRSRQVLVLNRPLQLKKIVFPIHEDYEKWQREEDLLWVSSVKDNVGSLWSLPFVFIPEVCQIFYKETDPTAAEQAAEEAEYEQSEVTL